MLNALVLIDSGHDLDETVKVAAKAARTPDGVGLVTGQRVTMRKLMQCMLVASANDAAEAIAIHVAGSEKKYVARMNAMAKSLGLTHTHAIDPHGLSKKEHSTAHELAIIAKRFMEIPVLRKTVKMRSVRAPSGSKVASTDKLLGHYDGLVGVKTGFTNPAGYCFVGKAVRGKIGLFSVVLGASSLAGRFSQTSKLLNWGFAGFKTKTLVSDSTTMGVVQVLGGVETSVSVHASRDATAVVWTRSERTRKIVLPSPINAPIHRGQQLGVVSISQDGTRLVSVPLLADSDVASVTVVATTAPVGGVVDVSAAGRRESIWSSISAASARAWAILLAGLRLGGSAAVASQ